MLVFSCNNITKTYGADLILNDVSFNIHNGNRIGVVGANGAGKTTLFKIMTGIEGIDKGTVNIPGTTTIGYLSQHPVFDGNQQVWDYLLENFTHLIEMENRLRELEKIMANSQDSKLEKLMKEYGKLTEEFTNEGGYEYKSLIRGALKGLGIDESQFHIPLRLLSGGQQTRVALAQLLLKKHRLLLLDEPTNYLDIEATEWLECFLTDYDGTVMIISHDRYFLDRLCNRIFEIRNTKLFEYKGNYSDYIVQKKTIIDVDLRHYKDQNKEIKRQQEIIKQLKSFNREKSLKRARSRENQLGKIDILQKPVTEEARVKIKLEPSIKSGRDVLTLENIKMDFPEKSLFENVNLKVYRGDIVGIIGPNGVGKTTLFNIISGKIPLASGDITKGHNVNIAYYHQQQENINQDNTVLDEVWNKNPHLSTTHIRNILAAFVFNEDDVYKKIKDLSGGEKSRIALINMMLSKSNLLLLDEPTNHLDIQSREVLEDALIDYSGTVLVISHDRYFLDRVTTKISELTPEGINLYYGNYGYYRMKKQQQEESLHQKDNGLTKTAIKQQRKKEKEEKEQLKQKKKKLQEIEDQIMYIEVKIEQLELSMCQPEVYTNAEKSKTVHSEIMELKEKLDKLYGEWENIVL